MTERELIQIQDPKDPKQPRKRDLNSPANKTIKSKGKFCLIF